MRERVVPAVAHAVRDDGRVRSKDTKPENDIRSAAHALGHPFRIRVADLPSKPDLANKHSGYRYTTMPETRADFWQSKCHKYTARDARAVAELSERGWRVAVAWECALRGAHAAKAASELSEWLIGSEPLFETEPIA